MKRLYGIYDRVAAELIGRAMYILLTFRTDEEAARYFADAINDNTTILHKHPADYELLNLGSMDDQGNIDSEIRHVITGDALVALISNTNNELPDTNPPRHLKEA